MGAAPDRSCNAIARRDLTRIYAAAVSAVAPAYLVGRALDGALAGAERVPEIVARSSRIFLLAVGKAAPGMASEIERRLGAKIESALAVVLAGSASARLLRNVSETPAVQISPGIRTIAAAHPLLDDSSQRAAEAALELVRRAGPDGLVILALSGGASSMMAMPAAPVTLADKIAINTALLRSGASIRELNIVRRHLSAIKGGGLLRAASQTRILGLVLSDVAHNDLATIGSGPAAADPSTFAEAIGVLKRRKLWGRAPESVRERLERGSAGEIAETLKSGDPILDRVDNFIIGDNAAAVAAAADSAASAQYTVDRWRELAGEADDLGRALAAHLAALGGDRMCVVAGGEPVVTIRGSGKGGRAQQMALAMALELERLAPDRRVIALCAGTDGVDGPTAAAGAFVSPHTAARAREAGFDPAAALKRNDACPLFAALGDLLITGPTGTNVSDLFVALVNY